MTVTGTSGTRTRSGKASVTVRKPVAGTGAIGINFVGSGTASMGVTEVAGVVPMAGWNNAAGAARSTPLALQDDTGASTGATVVWQANVTWATPITDAAGDRRMMRGYLDSTSTSSVSLTVAGLAPRTYDVYVDGANSIYARTAAYTISGPGIATRTIPATDPASTNFSSTFTQASDSAGNYVKFTVAAGAFTLTAQPVSGGNTTLRAPINGLQIVPAP